MIINTIELLHPIGIRLIKEDFCPSALARVMIEDGGLDMEPLTEADLIALMEGKFNGSWESVVFSFSELLIHYSNIYLNNYQVIAWCFAVLTMGEAVRNAKTDWELRLASMAKGFNRVTSTLQYREFSVILEEAFNP
jgi:hypothetical protein